MPLPKPKAEEAQRDFMIRCNSDDVMKKEYPNEQQRLAVCYVTWRDRNKKR